MESLLVRGAQVGGEIRDLRAAHGVVAQVGAGLVPLPGERVIEAAGGALLPGLHDHHVHLDALAAARVSVELGSSEVGSAGELAGALARAVPDADGWVRGVGYHEGAHGDLDRWALDAAAPHVPTRVQHRSGRLWVLNSAALELVLGLGDPGPLERVAGAVTGRLYDADGWLAGRLALLRGAGAPRSLAPVGRELASWGITGVTDATPGNDPARMSRYARAQDAWELPQRLHVMGSSALNGVHEGGAWGGSAVSVGPLKLHLHEDSLPALGNAIAAVRAAHAAGRTAAMHAVTVAELFFAIEVYRGAGVLPGDRVEHAALAPDAAAEALAELGITVVTQPGFVRERGDSYAKFVEPELHQDLYRLEGLRRHGVPLAGSSDAPYSSPNPFAAMAAAVARRTRLGAVLGPDEALSPEAALRLYLAPLENPGGAPRTLHVGAVADLCLLDRPWERARTDLASVAVAMTAIRGRLAWRPPASGIENRFSLPNPSTPQENP